MRNPQEKRGRQERAMAASAAARHAPDGNVPGPAVRRGWLESDRRSDDAQLAGRLSGL